MSRRRGRARRVALAALVVSLFVLVPLWIATRAVFFLGTDDDGFLAVYQGVPYDLPAGVPLYTERYVSGVPAAELAPGTRRDTLDHDWLSRDDAFARMRRLERDPAAPLVSP